MPMSSVDVGPVASTPPDAELLSALAARLGALGGPIQGTLSRLVEDVCATSGTRDVAERSLRLETELAEYLAGWGVLPHRQTSPDGLDAWAAGAPMVFLRAACAGCARCLQGGVR